MPFRHYCHGLTTQARLFVLHSSHPLPLDVGLVYLRYQQY